MRVKTVVILLFSVICLSPRGHTVMTIPEDFPRFLVPGHEKEMESLREMFWLHYPGSGPKSTLWDEWLSGPGLWPAVQTSNYSRNMREQWSKVLSERIIDPEGYVATHQHPSIAHQLGWPFPFWNQGSGGYGWHFSFKDTIGPPWRTDKLSTQEGWTIDKAEDAGISEYGWVIKVTDVDASVKTPKQTIDTFQSPFIQLRWIAKDLGSDAQPYIEWTTKESPRFSSERRMYFQPASGPALTYTMIPVYKHPEWKGEITRLRIGFGNRSVSGEVTIHSFFTQYDTRHNINSQNFVRGSAKYFWWTRDANFLRNNINRMRNAMRYVMNEHQALKRKIVYTDWTGHDGRTGLQVDKDGKKIILSGHGIGNNYWDLLPFGNLDCYATIHYYDALRYMAKIEREIKAHPEWNMPIGLFYMEPDELEKHAAEVKVEGNKLFWNPETKRFVACVDADGKTHDFGFTFLNFEAVCYDFATPQHAKDIMSWLSGERTIKGDTAQGDDIYHWRFAPRATTKRNIEWYLWVWSSPEGIPWGGQVQDGGAVLGFSYHDLMSRMKTRGPDDAWKRLQEIIKWFDEVEAAGGYRKYYDGSREGTLQGGGTAGGLGLDHEFFESVLVPQFMMDGFMGFEPMIDGFRINPRLPSDWPSYTIDRIYLHDSVFRVTASHDSIDVVWDKRPQDVFFVYLPEGEWRMASIDENGKKSEYKHVLRRSADGAVRVDAAGKGISFSSKIPYLQDK